MIVELAHCFERTERFLRKLPFCVGLLAGCWTLAASAQTTGSVTLAWDPSLSSGITGYRLYQGTASQTYTTNYNLGNTTNTTTTGLTYGVTYYFAVTALDTNGLESLFSGEVAYTPTLSTPPVIALTSPANNATCAAPGTFNLAASVTANGHTISKVQFFNGATLLAEDTASPYTFAWNNVAAGNYTLSATAIYDAGSAVSSGTVNVAVMNSIVATNPPATTLPAPWLITKIGTQAATGSVSVVSNLYTVSGSGNLSGRADNFQFMNQPMSGNGEIRAQITSLQNASNALAGVMVRETLTSGSKYAFVGIAPVSNFRLQTRNKTSGSTSATALGTAAQPNSWVRLVRSGNTFVGYSSADGVAWTNSSSKSIGMATNVYVGLAVVSGSTNTLSTATFTNLIVVP